MKLTGFLAHRWGDALVGGAFSIQVSLEPKPLPPHRSGPHCGSSGVVTHGGS